MIGIKQLYNRLLRDRLPRKWTVYNDVPVFDGRLLDTTQHHPNIKAGFLNAIDEYVTTGDAVVDIVAGRGIAAVHEARAGGIVHTYEASEEMINVAVRTLTAANCFRAVAINHAIVGSPGADYNHWGETGDADVIPPADLPDCAVLVLDCEGAEMDILQSYDGSAETVIVETHPVWDAPTSATRQILESDGYATETREYEPRNTNKKVVIGQLG